jgi:hypothetical protein
MIFLHKFPDPQLRLFYFFGPNPNKKNCSATGQKKQLSTGSVLKHPMSHIFLSILAAQLAKYPSERRETFQLSGPALCKNPTHVWKHIQK